MDEIMFLLERKYRDGSKLIKITARELFTAAVLAIAVFSVSNISFAFTGTPFSSQFTAEIFIIRTTVDLGGVAMLFAYHVVILEISTEREMEHLQALLHMQYESYRISEESIALVNQKYHDLKHHIQLLRAASAAERTEYLDQMEQQIRTYEAQNKTGNRVLDTILTAKTIQCQSEGISLTCVADGQALDFMNPMDISALFGNALDNAIESVKKLPNPEQRLIHVSAMRQKDFLRIRVENCYSGELRFVDGMPTTTKRDARYHGYGLKSIQSIANSYGGWRQLIRRMDGLNCGCCSPCQRRKREKRQKSVMKGQKHKKEGTPQNKHGKALLRPSAGRNFAGKAIDKGAEVCYNNR